MHLALLNPEPSKQSQHTCQYFGRGKMKILWLLHTYWHTSVPLRKVSHLPPLRQDSASCVHRKPAERRRALPTAQGPVAEAGGSLGMGTGSSWPPVSRGLQHLQGDGVRQGPGAESLYLKISWGWARGEPLASPPARGLTERNPRSGP